MTDRVPTRAGTCQCGNCYDAGDLATVRISGRWLCLHCAEAGMDRMPPDLRNYVKLLIAYRRRRIHAIAAEWRRMDAKFGSPAVPEKKGWTEA